MDDKLIDQIPYNSLLGQLQAIRFKLDGYGKLDDIKLSKANGEVVDSNAFDRVESENQ